MSAFSADGDFVSRLPAHPLRADAPSTSFFGRLLVICGHTERSNSHNLGRKPRTPASDWQVARNTHLAVSRKPSS
jgi:hypothetical protein